MYVYTLATPGAHSPSHGCTSTFVPSEISAGTGECGFACRHSCSARPSDAVPVLLLIKYFALRSTSLSGSAEGTAENIWFAEARPPPTHEGLAMQLVGLIAPIQHEPPKAAILVVNCQTSQASPAAQHASAHASGVANASARGMCSPIHCRPLRSTLKS
jgi:hypothetical protein